MTSIDWIGFTGVTILLLAFFLNLKGSIANKSLPYLILNFLGAGLACIASALLHYWPFIILEGCWTLVSLVSLLSVLRKDKSTGETDLKVILRNMHPTLNSGEYVFCTDADVQKLSPHDPVMFFREEEGNTAIISKEAADNLNLNYSFIASWITLTVHSSLEAIGLTAAISKALTKEGISCNVVAAYYHDHIFVNQSDAVKAMHVLKNLLKKS